MLKTYPAERLLIGWTAFVFLLGICVFGTSLSLEFFADLAPCQLCLWQRWPYYFALPASAFGLHLSYRAWASTMISHVMTLVAVTFFAGACLGVYSAGVEWGWWLSTLTPCSKNAPLPADVQTLLLLLSHPAPVSCQHVQWRFLGLSLSGFNAIFSGILSFSSLKAAQAARRIRRTEPEDRKRNDQKRKKLFCSSS